MDLGRAHPWLASRALQPDSSKSGRKDRPNASAVKRVSELAWDPPSYSPASPYRRRAPLASHPLWEKPVKFGRKKLLLASLRGHIRLSPSFVRGSLDSCSPNRVPIGSPPTARLVVIAETEECLTQKPWHPSAKGQAGHRIEPL